MIPSTTLRETMFGRQLLGNCKCISYLALSGVSIDYINMFTIFSYKIYLIVVLILFLILLKSQRDKLIRWQSLAERLH